MTYQHAVVWVDHQHATVIDFTVDDKHVQLVEKVGGQHKVHRRSGVPGSGKAPVDHVYFDAVATAIGTAREILLVGPGNAKVELRHDLEHRHPKVAERIVGVESADHPSDAELLVFAKKYFKRVDALRGE